MKSCIYIKLFLQRGMVTQVHRNKDNWIKVVERRGQSILISSYFYNGIQTKYFRKSAGLSVGLDHYRIKDYCNYYRQSEVSRFQRMMDPAFHKAKWGIVQKVLQGLYRKGEQLLRYADKISRDSQISQHALQHFKKFSELCLQFGPAMYFPILIEPQVETEAKRIIRLHVRDDPDDVYTQLTTTVKPTEGTNELVHLYRISEKYFAKGQDAAAIHNLCLMHLRRYGWLSFTKFVGEPWTVETLLQRMRSLSPGTLTAERIALEKRYPAQKKLAEEIMRRWQFSPSEKKFFRMAQELAFFRTDRIDTYTKAGYMVKNLFCAVAEKLDLSEQELMFLTYVEILTHLEKKKTFPRETILQRMKRPWELSFAKGKMTFRYLPEHTSAVSENSSQTIRGQVASRGFAKGEVRVIRGVLEFDKMHDGAILVTSMTTPDFVPLMQRAAAIVTDEGGITCHAAIVSRELKKPCIIGTRNATQVLKDGDRVEVDAEKGIVEKLFK